MLIPFDLLLYIVFLGLWLSHPEGAGTAAADGSPGEWMRHAACAGHAAAAAWLAAGGIKWRLRRVSRLSAAGAAAWKAALGATARGMTLGLSVYILLAGQWPVLLAPDRGLATMLWGLSPYLFTFITVWTAFQPVYAKVDRLSEAACPAQTGRLRFVLRQAQYGLYFLVIWVPLAIVGDWLLEAGSEPFAWVATAAILCASPVALVKIWRCRPVEPGPLRDRIRALESRAGVRFSRAYWWPLEGSRSLNAAAMGFMPPFRYLLLTPDLVNRLPAPELDAVIAHELGHARLRHQLTFALAGMMVLAGIFSGLAWLPLASFVERALWTAAVLVVFFRFCFGYILRIMERQADLFAMRLAGSAEPMASALERIAAAAGALRSAPSWHHYGIAQRVDLMMP